ncbi:lytic transglycosylase domain-containing protein [Pigmentibacter ruber]|nr:hypothetical protein GTC16762_22880 [Pigmentibacter ruber]
MGCKSHFSFFNIFYPLAIAIAGCLSSIPEIYGLESSNSEVIGKKYITFYQDFLRNKKQEEIKHLDEIKKQIGKEKNGQEKIFLLLGLLNNAGDILQDDYVEFARKSIQQSKIKMTDIQNHLYRIYYANYLYLKKDYAGAILLLKPIAKQNKLVVFQMIAPLYLDALLDAGLKAEAIDYYKSYGNIIEQYTNWEKMNEVLVKLSQASLFFSQFNQALAFLKKPLLFYPLEKSGRDAMDIVSKIECSGGSLGSLYFREENLQYLSKEVYKRIGKQPDSRNYILALVGINPFNPVPSRPFEQLSSQEKDKILGNTELLLSAREYSLADHVLNYLSENGNYSDLNIKDRILDMRGRVFNALNQPIKASQVYFKLFTEIPNSKFAEIAKMKYAVSLHYARNHIEAAEFAKKNYIFSTIEEQNWFILWEYILAKKYDEAESVAINFLNQSKKESVNIKFQYWLSVIQYEKGMREEAKKTYQSIAKRTTEYPYSIFSRWKLNNYNYKNQNISENLGIKDYYSRKSNPFLKRKIKDKNLEEIRKLILSDLEDVAIIYIKKINTKKMKKNQVVLLANLAYAAKDFKISSDLARNNFVNTLEEYGVDELWTEKTNFWKLNYPLAYWKDIQNAAKLADIDPLWLLSIMRAESLYYPTAESSVGAIGLMQIMPYTGMNISKHIGKENFNISLLKEPSQSIAYAAWYLRMLLKIYKGNYLLATAAYNGGPEAVNRWIGQNNSLTIDEFYENIPFQETKKYVAKVLGYLDIYYRVQLGNSDGYNLDFGDSLPDPFTKLNIF